MDNLSQTIADDFVNYYIGLEKRVVSLASSLSEEQFWSKPFHYGNSFGHLVLHITGNLNYYIGTQIVGTGYIRDREREFTEANPPSKTEAIKNLNQAIMMVVSAIKAQSAEDWVKGYTAAGEEDAGNRFNIFLRCAAHFYHHVGQMIYLSKEWSFQ